MLKVNFFVDKHGLGLDRGAVGFFWILFAVSYRFIPCVWLESAPVMLKDLRFDPFRGLSTILLDKALDMNQSTSCILFVLADWLLEGQPSWDNQ